jgi:protein ImuB
MLWLALDFPRLPLEVLTRGQASVPAIAVCQARRVLMVSQRAREAGVESGMRQASAETLSPALQCLPRAPEREQRTLRLLAARLLDFTPQVSLQPDNGLVLEVGGCLKLFGGLDPLLSGITGTLREAGFQAQPALGPTPLAAWQLTRLPWQESLACWHQPQPEAAFHELLASLPVSRLRLPEALSRRLSAPGFGTLGELLALPRHTLGKRHGRSLLLWLEQLLGERPDRRTPLQPPARFSGDIEFADPVSNSQGLLFPMQRLLDDLAAHLRRHQQSVTAIRWHFHPRRGPSETLVVRRARPAHEAHAWLALTRRKLEHQPLNQPVLTLSLDTDRPQPRHVQASTLFLDPAARPERGTLLERLATLPDLHCYTPREQDDPLPEAADTAANPLTNPPGETIAAAPFSDRPLWLLTPPQHLTFQGEVLLWQEQPLEWLPGEERFSSHWWQPDNHVREYRIARHPSGLCCWVFRERRSGQWFLQGLF